jgi:hypothetical protein
LFKIMEADFQRGIHRGSLVVGTHGLVYRYT